MRELFEQAAFLARSSAARRGIPFHENPLQPGPLSRFARQWDLGWSEFVARISRAMENTEGGEP